MKEVIERICTKQLIFTSLQTLDSKTLHTRKKFSLYSGVDQKSFYHVIFVISQKSRFITKHATELFVLEQQLETNVNHAYKYKHLWLKAPLCSKAAALLNESEWKVYHDFMWYWQFECWFLSRW